MKITFVYPDYFEDQEIHQESQGRVYLGIGQLAAVLRGNGHECELIHLVKPGNKDKVIGDISDTKPDLIAFSATTLQFAKIKTLAKWIKEELDLPIICGGVHPTIAPEDSIAVNEIDYICIGEGEGVLLDLCSAMEEHKPLDRIAGLWGKSNSNEFRNRTRPLIEDLDSLPFPDRSIFLDRNLAANQKNRLTVMASRGCPFNCSYCCNHALKRVYPNQKHYTRFRSPENVIQEIEMELGRRPGIETVRFDDDILALNRSWLKEFSALYESRVGLPYVCNARADLLSEESVELLSSSGCITAAIGIESGNPWLRRNVLGRSMDDDAIHRAFRLCRDYGIKTVSLNMVGFPHETMDMALDTVKMNAKIDPDLAQATTLYPFPGTTIFEICKREGMLRDSTTDTLFSGRSPLDLDLMSREVVNLISENFILLKAAYQKIFKLPHPAGNLALILFDFFLHSRVLPIGLKRIILQKFRSRLDWRHFIGVDY